jgi:transcriptional regulator with XRE-family HTH domain
MLKTIAENIKETAKEQGRSLSWVAREIGVSKTGFFKMLEANSFKSETLNKIANALKVPAGNLMAGRNGITIPMGEGTDEEQTEQAGKMLMAFGSVLFQLKLNEYLDAVEKDESKSKMDIIKELKALSKNAFMEWAQENTLKQFKHS